MTTAVIGAGVAGLSCAGRLRDAGARVTVFDKARGPGGRLSTARGDDWQADQGAQYFTARDPAFRRALRQWEEAGVAAAWRGRLVWLEEDGGTRVVDDGRPRYVGTPRMTAISRYLSQGLDVRPAVRVGGLQREANGVRLRDVAGDDLGLFGRVVVAVPAPQAESLLRVAAPVLAGQAAEAVMQGCWSVVVSAPGMREASFDAAFVRNRPLRWISRDASKPGRPDNHAWVLHASADWTERHMARPAEWVTEQLLACFREAVSAEIGSLTVLRAHRWRYASSRSPLQQAFLLDADGIFGACGDWCNGDRVEGAWLSGQALAERMTA